MSKHCNKLAIQIIGMALALIAAPLATAATVADAIWTQLQRESRVRVVVVLPDHEGQERGRAALAEEVDRLLATLPTGSRLERRFETVPALALSVDRAGLEALAASSHVARVDLDEGGSGGLLQGLPLARIDVVKALGLTGAGRKVAIIDSGTRLDHQSFGGRIVDEACFCTGCCPNGGNTQIGPGSGANSHPHGTNVAGIAAGATGVAGVPAGAATAASIISIRVLDANNAFCCSSDIVAAMDWLRVNHPDATVANLSLGTGSRFAGDCDQATAFTQSMAAAVNGLVAQGTAVTVSSGNNASSIDMQAPACVRNAISVGAVYDANVGAQSFGSVCTAATTSADQMACFSNLSATTDLVAPGAPITAAGTGSATATSTFSGTSMAAPTTAGCIALLRQAQPQATVAQIETALKASPTRILRSGMSQDFPRLDCADALAQLQSLDRIFRNGFD